MAKAVEATIAALTKNNECVIMLHGNPLPPHYLHWVDYV
jgi:hypothetical protein